SLCPEREHAVIGDGKGGSSWPPHAKPLCQRKGVTAEFQRACVKRLCNQRAVAHEQKVARAVLDGCHIEGVLFNQQGAFRQLVLDFTKVDPRVREAKRLEHVVVSVRQECRRHTLPRIRLGDSARRRDPKQTTIDVWRKQDYALSAPGSAARPRGRVAN